VRLKRYRHGLPATLPSPLHNLTQYVRVRAMHAVKVPNAYQGRTKLRRNVVELVKNLHGFRFNCGRLAAPDA
jgi:hypothetical protein